MVSSILRSLQRQVRASTATECMKSVSFLNERDALRESLVAAEKLTRRDASAALPFTLTSSSTDASLACIHALCQRPVHGSDARALLHAVQHVRRYDCFSAPLWHAMHDTIHSTHLQLPMLASCVREAALDGVRLHSDIIARAAADQRRELPTRDVTCIMRAIRLCAPYNEQASVTECSDACDALSRYMLQLAARAACDGAATAVQYDVTALDAAHAVMSFTSSVPHSCTSDERLVNAVRTLTQRVVRSLEMHAEGRLRSTQVHSRVPFVLRSALTVARGTRWLEMPHDGEEGATAHHLTATRGEESGSLLLQRSVFRLATHVSAELRMPAPVLEYSCPRTGYTLDIAWPTQRMVLEVDAHVSHAAPWDVHQHVDLVGAAALIPRAAHLRSMLDRYGMQPSVDCLVRQAALRAHGWCVLSLAADALPPGRYGGVDMAALRGKLVATLK